MTPEEKLHAALDLLDVQMIAGDDPASDTQLVHNGKVLRVKWMPLLVADLRRFHSMDAEKEFASLVLIAACHELHTEIMEDSSGSELTPAEIKS